jgi:hypothetical protein
MSLMNHSPAAEWSIRKTTDRSDPSFNVIVAATRVGPIHLRRDGFDPAGVILTP